MKKENYIIAAAIEREAKERNLATNKRYKVVLNTPGEPKEQYFDTLSGARNAISEARRDADIYHRRNTSAEFDKVETSRPVAEKRWIRYTIIAKAGTLVDAKLAEKIAKEKSIKEVSVKPFVTDKVEYLDAMEEEKFHIGSATLSKDEFGNITDTLLPVRYKGEFLVEDVNLVR